MKSLLALFLGLVFQLAWVRAEVIPYTGGSMPVSCCKGHCPCLQKSSSDQKPAPVLPAASSLKDVSAKAEETDIVVAKPVQEIRVVTQDEVVFQRFTGYPGVRFSVAFCRFTI